MIGDPIGAILCAGVGLLVIGLPILAIILRASVGLSNKFLGQSGETGGVRYEETALPPAGQDAGNPYAIGGFSEGGEVHYGSGSGIPEPSFGKAYGIVLVAAICGFPIGFIMGLLQVPPLLANVINLLVAIPINVLVFSKMLPTTIGRATLVYVCQVLISIAVVILIAGIIMGVSLATR